MVKKTIAIGVVALLFSSIAYAKEPCLEFGRIWNWKVIDNKTLLVEDETHQKFKVALMGTCPDIQFNYDKLGFQSRGSSRVNCMSPGDDVIFRSVGIPNRCPITSITPYTPEMEKSDKAAADAKAGGQK